MRSRERRQFLSHHSCLSLFTTLAENVAVLITKWYCFNALRVYHAVTEVNTAWAPILMGEIFKDHFSTNC